MPELPEVETIVRDLQYLIVGRRIQSVHVHLNKIALNGPRRLARFLVGAEVRTVRRKGKFIVFSLSGNRYLVVHLKMTGQFLWGGDLPRWPEHVHVKIIFEDGKTLYYRDMRQFGYFLGLSSEEYGIWLAEKGLGPDPFEITPEEFVSMLSQRRGRIKALLLNQQFISGLGNIYTDEALYAAGIHPVKPAADIAAGQARRLHEEICGILKEAIRLKGSTTRNYIGLRGERGTYQERHRVYGRSGEYCPTCGTAFVRSVVAGRGTHFCPCCQSLD